MGHLSQEEIKMIRAALSKAVSKLTWEEGTLIKLQRKMTMCMVRGESTLEFLPLVQKQKDLVEEIREDVKRFLVTLGLPLDASKNSKPGEAME